MISRRTAIAYFLVMTVTPADAQPAEAEAEVLYGNGRKLMSAGKVPEACTAFEKSYRLDPAVTTIIALATCREKLGRLANARELFLMAERQTRSASDNVTTQLHTIARDRAAKLEPRVPKLTINVPVQSKIDGLEILRDTIEIPVAMWNRALPIDGGTYKITARVPGAKEWSTTVTLAPEVDTKTVDVPDLRKATSSLKVPSKVPAVNEPMAKPRIIAPAPGISGPGQEVKPPETPANDAAAPRPPPPPPPLPPSPLPPAAPRRSPWYRDVLGDVLVASGVVSLALGGVLYRSAVSDINAAEGAPSLDSYVDLVDSARTKRPFSVALIGGGVALIGAGVLRFVMRGPRTEARRVAVTPARGGGLVTWSRSF